MYAFNKRFRPTLHFGMFTLLTLALGMLGLVMIVFSIAAVFQMDSPPLGLILFFGGIIALFFALRDHLNQKTRRVKFSMFAGSLDRKRKGMDVING